MKDQGDVKGMPTTLGSVLFKDYMPRNDAFVVAKLRKAGVVFLGKATLGELGGGDTHGSLFGSTRNVYDLERTAGGSSGGSGASVSANFCTVAVGQEGFASIRRPVDLERRRRHAPDHGPRQPRRRLRRLADGQRLARPDGAHRHRSGEAARLHGRLRSRGSGDRAWRRPRRELFSALDKAGAQGRPHRHPARDDGYHAEPDSDDFKEVAAVFDRAVADLAKAGAEIVDPIVIPDLKALLATRARSVADDDTMFELFFGGGDTPFKTRAEAMASPLFAKSSSAATAAGRTTTRRAHQFLKARETLMTAMLKVMADHRLDAIVHKAVEHPPTLIRDGANPPFVDQKGAPHINTFLVFVPSIVVPAGFTRRQPSGRDHLLGRPYDDATMIRFAYAYEQATHHRRPPTTLP